jgi:TolB-like protein/Tfp pilus assembly protein PilF
MQIWSAEIKELETLYTSIKGQFPELEKELERLIRTDDENIVLVYARRCLEVIITDLCECELKRPRKTEPLQGIIDKLNREEKIPSHIFASMLSLNSLSTFGSHPKEFDPRQVKPVLLNLTTIIEWYLKYKNIEIKTSKEQIKEKIKPEYTGSFENSIAVLPFQDMSPQKDQEYFCDGMTEEILNALTHVESLKVIARSSSFVFKDKYEDIREIGRKLDVEALLEGSVRKAGNKLRITAQLIKVEDSSHLWSEHYDRELEDIFDIQDEISLAIVENLKVKLLGKEKTAIMKRHTDNPDAYNLYLKGNYFWNKRTKENLKKSISYFEEAIKMDSAFSLAYTGLADSYIVLGEWWYYPSNEVFPKAKEAAIKSIELDYELAEAHNAMAAIKRDYEWNWSEAEKEYLKAIELNPNYPTAYQWYAEFLSIMNRHQEAIENIVHAQKLDPLSPIIYTLGGYLIYHNSKQYDQAIMQCQKALEIDSNYVFTYYALVRNYLALEMYEEAIKEAKKALFLSDEGSLSNALLAQVYALSGKRNEAEVILNELVENSNKIYISETLIARIYIALNMKDQALEWLQKAYLNRNFGLIYLNESPTFDSLRTEPEFIELLKKIGF